MATSKSKKGLEGALTVLIYIFLAGGIATYFLPTVGLNIPAVGEISWNVRDIVKTIPKGFSPTGGEKTKLSVSFDVIDLVRAVEPAGEGKIAVPKRLVHLAIGALVPVALGLTYLVLVLGLLTAPLKKSGFFIFLSGFATVCAAYAVVGVFYLNALSQQVFSEALAKAEESPFFFVTQHFVKDISVRPDVGMIALLVLTALTFVTALGRMSQSGK